MLRINRGVVIVGKSILLLILTYENWSLSKMSDNALPNISFWTLFFSPSHQITAHSNTSLFSHWQLLMHIVLFLFFYADSNTCQSCFISFWQTDKKKKPFNPLHYSIIDQILWFHAQRVAGRQQQTDKRFSNGRTNWNKHGCVEKSDVRKLKRKSKEMKKTDILTS